MEIQYTKSSSYTLPETIDAHSSKKYVYIRQNIIVKTDVNEENPYYEYDEAKLTREEYKQYLSELSVIDIQQQRADIDYIALMSGVDLEG